MKIILLSLLMVFSQFARAGECAFTSSPQVILQAEHELHQVWAEEDRNEFQSPDIVRSGSFQNYLVEIKNQLGDINPLRILEKEYFDFINSGDAILQAEAPNLSLVLRKQAGRLRSTNCFESLLLSQQVERGLSWEVPMEFSSFVLKRTIGKRSLLKIYYSTNDRPGGKFNTEVMKRIQVDVKNGWLLWRHIHNHNFNLKVSSTVTLQGAPSPSLSDVDTYRKLRSDLGLMSASVTNGFDTVDILKREFEIFHAK